jgi:type II secretory pathway component PulM
MLAEALNAFPHRLKFVLHAGTPKTGTKALQTALYRGVDALAQAGVWYPPALVDPEHKKHQYLVSLLIAGEGATLTRAFEEIVRSAPPQTRTIVLSSEGFYQHWWDFAPESKVLLRQLASLVDLEVWACFREPVEFVLTQYAQLLRNPREFAPAYGLDAGLEEMLEDEWFVQRLDYLGFVFEIEELIGNGKARLFRYGPDIVARVFAALGAGAPAATAEIVNRSLRRPGVELMRIVNRYDLPAEHKYAAAALVLELDQMIGERAEPLTASPAIASRIEALTARDWEVMEELLQRAEDEALA